MEIYLVQQFTYTIEVKNQAGTLLKKINTTGNLNWFRS